MDWTLYLTEVRPNPLAEVVELMRIGNEHIVQLLLAAIVGVASMGVAKLDEVAKKIQVIEIVMTESRAENAMRFNHHSGILQDHENRVRLLEGKRNR